MGLSSVDPVTKLELHEVLSRYCWSLDHVDMAEWEQLFTIDAHFAKPGMETLEGRAAIMRLPEDLQSRFGGNSRHHFTNIIVDRAASGREMKVRALLTVRDCMNCDPVASADCIILMRRTDHWRIASFEATSVCKANGLPRAAGEGEARVH
ncbi:nuclear transport factor 2 family protein [Sphingomonas sp. Y38-1Y]|uniref:nuclear transport factor 2 family protein n=1 Tax=Sphingomonas sp. Y38-1Y TaxID=3078265 RepID=UPI0028E8F6C0|nr:nuclear transport factor 2 family protein [Sphingomonas sp. Y38-1Y]